MSFSTAHLFAVSDQDGAAVLDTKRGTLTRLNFTGNYVWERLLQRQSVDQIVKELAEETGAEISVVENDVRTFLEQARMHHLVRAEEV